MAEWDGVERRASDKISRREADTFCSEHHLRWEHHEQEKNGHRAIVCGKIGHLEKGIEELEKTHIADLKAMTPWKVFTVALLLIATCLGGVFVKIDHGQERIMQSIGTIHQRITANDKDVEIASEKLKDAIVEIKHTVESIDGRLKTVEKSLPTK